MAVRSATDVTESLIHHVALPPRLPGRREGRIDRLELALINRLLDATRTLRSVSDETLYRHWDSTRRTLQVCKELNAGGKLSKFTLVTEFRTLGHSEILILHITEQNAGLLVRRSEEEVVFEAFEASPLSETVLAATSALQWDFPNSAVAIPYSVFAQASFQDSLASFLEQASTESIKRFAAHSTKAGSLAFESRETVDPSLITQMLMTLLEVNGHRTQPLIIRKRVRDEVYWTDGAENPWRRSPLWLIVRVALQRFLIILHGSPMGRAHYKFLLCVLFRNLIEEAPADIDPDLYSFLQAKLARRLAKLEVEKGQAPQKVRVVYDTNFAALGALLSRSLDNASARLGVIWSGFIKEIQRPIPLIPRRAWPIHTRLSLPNSEGYLRKVLSWHTFEDSEARSPKTPQPPINFDASLATAGPFTIFANRFSSLARLETVTTTHHGLRSLSVVEHESRCVELAARIDGYISVVGDSYNSNTEEMSIMLLTVMELWVAMDISACAVFSLLLDYSPGIPPESLDVLQLLFFEDMSRLKKVQDHLRERYARSTSSYRTVFDDPARGCFAERYFNESPDSTRLQEMQQTIEAAATSALQRKEQQWRTLSADFERLQRTILQSKCTYITTDNHRSQHDEHCQKCHLENRRDRMKIHVHEHPLPSDPVQAKAVIFELSCPEAFTAYRNTTWKILGILARSKQGQSFPPRLTLFEYSELRAYVESTAEGICLASTAKSWLKTHYHGVPLPVDLDQICLPNGLRLGYYDTVTGAWPGRETYRPSFTHHCPIRIPTESPFSILQDLPEFGPDSDGPSSYKVLAWQTCCPPQLNEHEFMAYQSLFSGKHHRWLSILAELGSSNLNFGTEAATTLISQLAIQAGPATEEDRTLRSAHACFRDRQFCKRLIEQIDNRLHSISSNWREISCMELLLTLILRLCSLASEGTIAESRILLEKARATTLQWTSQLRSEIQSATTAENSRRCSQYVFRSALLCRRSFAMYAAKTHGPEVLLTLEEAELQCFIECSIALQDNMPKEPAALSLQYKNMLIRDLKMVYRMRHLLRRSLEAHPSSLGNAINRVWPQASGGATRRLSSPSSLDPSSGWWFTSNILSTLQMKQQSVLYHLLEGHLLIDWQPLGKLPAVHRESFVIGQLFGSQSLSTYPSSLRGMTYTVAFAMNGHQIHIGFRGRTLIVRACVRGTVLELIPRDTFGGARNFDLPGSLVEHCVHWLDLNTGVLEVRQEPDIWISKPSNWILDFNARTARRRTSTLIDPHSPPFQRIARIFDRFEYPGRLTVFQPEKGSLSVELRRLELSFFINPDGLLACRQLCSEIDPNQDAGTWYGLNSKLVLRDTTNNRQRSIIVPLGSAKSTRHRFHVSVDVENDGQYGRYFINDVLGRLDCPPEPRLLYLKAQFHACTSFIIPDPLTGRTGSEEALHCLRSGYCQPWTPLTQRPLQTLMAICKLTPRRQYYPKDARRMQQVFWDPDLTPTIQHDELRSAVEEICEKSRILTLFATTKQPQTPLELENYPGHLLRRSILRRRLYHRSSTSCDEEYAVQDLPYVARGCDRDGQKRRNVFESVSLLRSWPTSMHTTSDLSGVLQNWPSIGGFDQIFDPALLTGLLNMQPAVEWGSMVNFCRQSTREDLYRLMFLFALISYGAQADMDTVRVWIAYAVIEDLKSVEPPIWETYTDFRSNQVPTEGYLFELIDKCRAPYPGDERDLLQVQISHKMLKKLQGDQNKHEKLTGEHCTALVQALLEQWPCPEPTECGFDEPLLIDVPQAMSILCPEWLRLFQNLELSSYIVKVQCVLHDHHNAARFEVPNISIFNQEISPIGSPDAGVPITLHELLRKRGPLTTSTSLTNVTSEKTDHTVSLAIRKENIPIAKLAGAIAKSKALLISPEVRELERILDLHTNSQSVVRQRYGSDLRVSLEALKTIQTLNEKKVDWDFPPTMDAAIINAREMVKRDLIKLCSAIQEGDPRARWLQNAFLWPCITPVTLLEQLRSIFNCAFGSGMKEGLIAYARSITYLQQLLRMEDAMRRGHSQRLHDEQQNVGHETWNPLEYQDWLLLEIDSNILIRRDQVEVALASISPASGSNSVLQMNMGQGKTSCIMPMAATVMADTENLLRVIVPQSLLGQTSQLLQARLGGLLGREVRHVPFSRKTPTDEDTIKVYLKLHESVRARSGVIVALPEHILSFKLSGLQRLSDTRINEAKKMVQAETYFQRFSRDILDESDFTLAVRTQLVYPSGSQTTVDGHPHRWETVEILLRLVEGHLWNLRQKFPQSIEVIQRPQGGFPVIFFLRRDVEVSLIERLVRDIVLGQTSILSNTQCTQSDRTAIKQFISLETVPVSLVGRINAKFADKPAVKQKLYLVRGLLVHRILLLTLKKRWNVQYGLHPGRDPIAVPFHAKGVPSEQAEWGHPDVAILFTCLSFYYGGIGLLQLRQSLEHLVKSDDPSSEYDRWTHVSDTLPNSLREWNAINVDDEIQLSEIWQHVRYKTVVIDYFLNHFVFPKHAKQFRLKLQASGWDVPLFSAGKGSAVGQASLGKGERALTTGFSGTNDNRTMLPLTIKQADLPGLSHTNAEVLTYLLQRRSRRYMLAADSSGKHITEVELLQMLHRKDIRMLIDAGAQILEMDNLSLVKAWLKIDSEAPAALYFSADNKPYIYYRHGSQIPLSASPFADNLGDCLVYLDEAHTRGTDLKMPAYTVGALTLGLGQTKDHTVQAAMRLRQLATTQAILFVAPPEVHQSMLDFCKKRQFDTLDSHDVIRWLLEQSCSGIEQMQPLYYSQGVDFCGRTQAAQDNPDFLGDVGQREAYLGILRQKEQQTLEQLYGAVKKPRASTAQIKWTPEIATFMKDLNTRRKAFKDDGVTVRSSALQEVEQEREVAFEVEAVQERQKPVHYTSLSFPGLHRDIKRFAETGRLAANSAGYEHALVALHRTTIGQKYGINTESSDSKLYVSTEFTRTVSMPSGRPNNHFLRPVNWILWSTLTETALIIIPEEAELLIPYLRIAEESFTHLLTYAAPITRKMLIFNNLAYYAIPSLPGEWKAPQWLTIELGLFAGRLYFDFDEYDDLRKYLGLMPLGVQEEQEPSSPIDAPAHDDQPDHALQTPQKQQKIFTTKPLQFLQDWLAARRRGQDFTHTPMGHVCQDKPLNASHAFFAKVEREEVKSGSVQAGAIKQTAADHVEEGEDAGAEEDGDWGEDGFEEGEAQEGEGAGEVADWDEEGEAEDESEEESEGSSSSGGRSSDSS